MQMAIYDLDSFFGIDAVHIFTERSVSSWYSMQAAIWALYSWQYLLHPATSGQVRSAQ